MQWRISTRIPSQRPPHSETTPRHACGGIRTWNELGRRVKRGEKALPFLPDDRKRRKKENTDAGTDEESNQSILLGFRRVFVWKSNGRQRPSSFNRSAGDVSGYRERLVKFVEARHYAELFREDRPPRVCPTAEKSRCFPGCNPARNFPRWRTKSAMNFTPW